MSDEALKISCMTHFLSNLSLSHSAFFNYLGCFLFLEDKNMFTTLGLSYSSLYLECVWISQLFVSFLSFKSYHSIREVTIPATQCKVLTNPDNQSNQIILFPSWKYSLWLYHTYFICLFIPQIMLSSILLSQICTRT